MNSNSNKILIKSRFFPQNQFSILIEKIIQEKVEKKVEILINIKIFNGRFEIFSYNNYYEKVFINI